MRRFISRALNKLSKLNEDQIRTLILDLAMENDLLEVVLDSRADGVVVLDREDRVIFLNKAAQKHLPFLTGDPYEKPLWEVLTDQDVTDFVEDALHLQTEVYDREFSYGTGTGVRTLAYSIMPLVKEKNIQGRVLHIKDVTRERQEEARLRRAESLASLTTLAAGVAHEIKNPLGSMGIHIQLLQRALRGKEKINRKAMNEYLEVISEEVERLNGIVVDFLFAVRPMDIQPSECHLNKKIDEVISFVRFELEEKHIRIRTRYAHNLPSLSLDEKFIKQALLNLIKNAEAAMEGGGTLTFTTWDEGGSVYLSVQDTGMGIPEENLSKIFEPYFTTKDFGSGLGLTLIYKIIKEHRGDISVKSKKNRGTTFTFRFPVPRMGDSCLLSPKSALEGESE